MQTNRLALIKMVVFFLLGNVLLTLPSQSEDIKIETATILVASIPESPIAEVTYITDLPKVGTRYLVTKGIRFDIERLDLKYTMHLTANGELDVLITGTSAPGTFKFLKVPECRLVFQLPVPQIEGVPYLVVAVNCTYYIPATMPFVIDAHILFAMDEDDCGNKILSILGEITTPEVQVSKEVIQQSQETLAYKERMLQRATEQYEATKSIVDAMTKVTNE